MSSLPLSAAAAAASPTINITLHGHKRGAHLGQEGQAGSSAVGAATPAAGSTQSLFGTLLDSVEQVIGIKTNAVAAATQVAGAVSRLGSHVDTKG